MTDIVERLLNWCIDWNGAQMVCGEPPRDGLHCDDLLDAAAEIKRLRAASEWRDISTRPEFDDQPMRQFILLEGSCSHSGANWHRRGAGEAYIRKPGQPDEMLQYRMDDILRICSNGDIDPHSARVTHWMPGKYPDLPAPPQRNEVKK